MQPQMSVALVLANGTSMVTESIFENRFKYVDELARMGSNIKVEGNVAVIDGVKGLTGAQVNAPDLRAGAALVIAGLALTGIRWWMKSVISSADMSVLRKSSRDWEL